MQHGVERDVVDARHGRNVAGHRLIDLHMIASVQQEQVPDLERLAALAHIELRVLRHRALVHAEDPEFADVRIALHLEHVREHVPGRVGCRSERLRGVALALHEQRRIPLGGIGQMAREHLEQIAHAGARARRHETDRNDVPVAQRLLERAVQRRGIHVALLEVALHRGLVDLDDLLEHHAVHLAHRQEVGLARVVREAVDDARAAVGRQVDRQTRASERVLNRRHEAGQVDVLGVDAIDDDHPAQAAFGGPVHHPARHQFDAVLRVDDDRNGFHRVERANALPDEIGMPGRVDQVNARAAVVEVDDR